MPLEYNINRVTRSETITRRRRELHAMGMIDYSPQAETERYEAFKSECEVHTPAAIPWLKD